MRKETREKNLGEDGSSENLKKQRGGATERKKKKVPRKGADPLAESACDSPLPDFPDFADFGPSTVVPSELTIALVKGGKGGESIIRNSKFYVRDG